jgi:hypothetical protein
MSLDQPSFPQQEPVETPLNWPLHLGLFALTLLSVFHVGAQNESAAEGLDFAWLSGFVDPNFLRRGASFALPLMAILLTHEFGHYFAARWHRVPASLPFFIPLPGLGWGTLGAVIAMRGAIRSRKALFDIGASGPIAGLLVALPVLVWGLQHSTVDALPASYDREGQSLLYLFLKRIAVGPIPEGSDVFLHPTAMAGWVGLMITMINLFPWGQLDGGHIAFALFGERQHHFARWLRRGLLLLFVGNLAYFTWPALAAGSLRELPGAFGNSLFWLVWFGVTGLIARASGGADHPPFEPGELGRTRRYLAWACLALFALLFMPTPFTHH